MAGHVTHCNSREGQCPAETYESTDEPITAYSNTANASLLHLRQAPALCAATHVRAPPTPLTVPRSRSVRLQRAQRRLNACAALSPAVAPASPSLPLFPSLFLPKPICMLLIALASAAATARCCHYLEHIIWAEWKGSPNGPKRRPQPPVPHNPRYISYSTN